MTLALVASITSVLSPITANADCLEFYERALVASKEDKSWYHMPAKLAVPGAALMGAMITSVSSSDSKARSRTMTTGANIGAVVGAAGLMTYSSMDHVEASHHPVVYGALGGFAGYAVGRGISALTSGAAFESRNRELVSVGALAATTFLASAVINNRRDENRVSDLTLAKSTLIAADRIEKNGLEQSSPEDQALIQQVVEKSKSECSAEKVARFLARSPLVCMDKQFYKNAKNQKQLAELVASKAQSGAIGGCGEAGRAVSSNSLPRDASESAVPSVQKSLAVERAI